MSEVNLLVFGALVSFIVVAGVYVYVREQFAHEERKSAELPQEESGPRPLEDRNVASR